MSKERKNLDIIRYGCNSRIFQADVVKGRPSEPIALKTELGWLVSGRTWQEKVEKAGNYTAIPGNTKLK